MHSNNYLNSHIDISVLLQYRKEVIVEYMNHTTKTTTLGIATAIAAVTLALLVTAGIVVGMMMPVQTAHASCITSPKGQIACSGSNVCPLGPEMACSGG